MAKQKSNKNRKKKIRRQKQRRELKDAREALHSKGSTRTRMATA
jgi:hypothetical protein